MYSGHVKIGRRKFTVSHSGKVLYPATGFTKGQVIEYYVQISDVLLPHLKNRALTLKRYPNGVDHEFFYQKECPSFRPRWMQVVRIWSKTRRRTVRFCLVNDLPALVWVTNLANIELHASLARRRKTEQPTAMVFDLDPGPGANVVDCAQVALWLRTLLETLKLKSFPKTSGSKGLQLYVPLNTAATFDETKTFSRTLASMVAEVQPQRAVTRMSKRLREGKVLIDWSQNDHHKTTVSVYSLRALEQPAVSTPITWKELEKGLKMRSTKAFSHSPEDALKRVRTLGDLFEPVLTLKQRLPKDLSRAESAKTEVANWPERAG
jgi:bifunctional non-homologous end joining protein LigD